MFRLERDAWSMVKRLRQATNQYPPPPSTPPATGWVTRSHVEPDQGSIRQGATGSPPLPSHSMPRPAEEEARRPRPILLRPGLPRKSSESIEATVSRRRILSAGFDERTGEELLPRRVMLGDFGPG